MKLTTFILVMLFGFLQACGSSPARQPVNSIQQTTAATGSPHPVLEIAQGLLGTPYRYGGISPRSGFDCSGFVYYTHQQLGLSLPRTSADQFRHTRPVARQQLRPGDLVFFQTRRGRINHVGIYMGDNQFIHAPGKGKSISVTTLDHPYWEPRFARGGRPAF